MAKNNNWIWIVVIVGALFFFMNQQKVEDKKEFAFWCTSKEPTTLDGYKTEIAKWEGYTDTVPFIKNLDNPLDSDSVDCMLFGNKLCAMVVSGCQLNLSKDLIKNDYKVDMVSGNTDENMGEGDMPAIEGKYIMWCSSDKKFTIITENAFYNFLVRGGNESSYQESIKNIIKLSAKEDDLSDFKDTYFSKMYDCKLRYLESVSNTYAMYGGIAILVLLFLIILKFRK